MAPPPDVVEAGRLRELLRGVRGHKMANVIERINPVLRGWAGYFKLSQSKRPFEELDGWVRHKLRCVVWRQWKQPSTRARNLMRLFNAVRVITSECESPLTHW